MSQLALAARLAGETSALRAGYTSATTTLTAAELDRKPPGGGWSAGQVLEHVVRAHDDYAMRLRPLIARGEPKASAPDVPWKPTLVGRLLVASLENPRALRAPKIWRVDDIAPRRDVRDALDQRLAEVERLVTDAATLDWRRARTSSPVSRLIRLNLGDALMLLVVHARRHLGQVQRVRQATLAAAPGRAPGVPESRPGMRS